MAEEKTAVLGTEPADLSQDTVAEAPADDAAQAAAEGEAEEPASEAEGEPGEGEEQPVEYEEIEVNGQKYAIPKELKGAFLQEGDYRRKTQDVAERGKEVEAREAEVKAAADAQKADWDAHVGLAYLEQQIPQVDKQLEEYSRVDWNRFREENFVDYQTHWNTFQQLQFGRQQLLEKKRELTGNIERSTAERSRKASEDLTKRIDQTQRIVTKDIKGWGPELASKLTSFGADLGFTQEELFNLNTDPRSIKALHLAWLGSQLVASNKPSPKPTTGNGATATVISPGTKVVKPLTSVTQNRSRNPAASAEPSDRDSDEEWLRKRNAQVRRPQAAARH